MFLYEYICVQFWLYLKNDITELGKVQNTFSILEKKATGDIMKWYKVMHSIQKVFLSLSHNTETRSPPMIGRRFRIQPITPFPLCLNNLWNSLQQDLVMTTDLDALKGHWRY